MMADEKRATTTTIQVYKADADWLRARQRHASLTTESDWITMFDLIHALIEFVREIEGEG
jgi:hypothetical protein